MTLTIPEYGIAHYGLTARVYSTQEYAQISIPDDGYRYVRSFWDHESPRWDYQARNMLRSVPAMVPLYTSGWDNLTHDLQWFWFLQIVHSMIGEIHTKQSYKTQVALQDQKILAGLWRNATTSDRFLTNGRGTESRRDYISDRNQGEDLPGTEQLSCAGNIYRVLDGPITKAGRAYWMVQTIDTLRPLPDIAEVNYLSAPYLIHLATITRHWIEKRDGKEYPVNRDNGGRVDRFSFNNSQFKEIPYPLKAKGGIDWIRCDWTQEVHAGDPLPCPYNGPHCENWPTYLQV